MVVHLRAALVWYARIRASSTTPLLRLGKNLAADSA
jgi:hypothetical protein